MAGTDDQPVFYYDLGSPACYLAAEQVMTALPVVPEWEPVLASELGAAAFDAECRLVERLGPERGLQRVRWPVTFPADRREAMLAATYAKHIGRAVVFSLACFRQAFAGGRDLADRNTVLIAAAACEMHPTAVLKGIGLRSVSESLTRAGERAGAAGITTLPAVQLDGTTFEGSGAIELAARALQAAR